MDAFFFLAAALLGSIVGSFINALSFRWGTGVSIMHGRSRCMNCSHTLNASDLVPVFSYLFLRGKCHYCGSGISAQYPAVELLGAILGALVYSTSVDVISFEFWFVVWMVLLFVAIYDMRHTIIPWSCSVTIGILGLGWALWSGANLIALFAGPLLATPLLLLSLLSGGRWMGLGDGALMLGLGWLLGLTFGLTALVVAFWIGAIVGIATVAVLKRYKMDSEVPFAPFLIIGTAIAYFGHVDLFYTLPLLFI